MNVPNPESFHFELSKGVATITLDRPARLNSLTFQIYAELADTFEALNHLDEARAILITGRGKGFCSGGDQDDIIAELFSRDMKGLLEFTRMTGRLIRNIRAVRRPVVAAVNGVAVGAGAVIAAACDLRIASPKARFGYIFPQVGLCGADMGAAYLLPRLVGLGNASELLFRGTIIDAEHAYRIGLVNRIAPDPEGGERGDGCRAMALEWARDLARGPALAHTMTKQMLESEHGMSLDDAIEAEAQAQAICMTYPDFRTAHDAFKNKQTPVFAGAEITFDTSDAGTDGADA